MEQKWKSIALHLLWTHFAGVYGTWRSSDETHNIKVKPSIITVNTDGFQTTSNAYVGPWLLRIMDGDQFACGASYFRELYILTSASCMHKYKQNLDNLSVEFLSGNEFALIDTVYVSKLYEWPSNYMDIAVVKLVSPMPGYHSDYVKLCTKPSEFNQQLTVVGCGTKSQEVVTQQVSRLDQMDCSQAYNTISLTETVVCTHAFDNADECAYDFGCPVTIDDELCGVVAYGPACNNTALPGLFTDINKVKQFIKQVVNRDTNEEQPKKHRTWFDD